MSEVKVRSIDLTLSPNDNLRLANFCGPLDENLRQIEAAYDVTIARRGEQCRVSGSLANARQGAVALEHFYKLSTTPLTKRR